MTIQDLQTGDLIIRDKGPLSAHYMVYVGIYNGIPTVAENKVGEGVRYTSLDNALNGNSIKRFEKFGGTDAQRNMVIPRINELLGKAYDLVIFNCEHFARWIANGKVESRQVKVASNIALAGGSALLAAGAAKKNGTLVTLGVISMVLGGIGHASQR